ncbi:NACHT and WD repeat domain-containing protein 2 [Nymphon striatum]|nr:NACHT and WD repeat domain-containing protein 2 [Nymphon striatum]
MDDSIIDQIFSGSLENLPPISTKIVRIFTSSTFTDTQVERNMLMEQIYPKLKEFCREKHGLEFQVVDMRWGVRDEATDDHLTTQLCMNEIKNCQRVSIGPNFVVFLGQKYGYRPIPTFIDSDEFTLTVDALIKLEVDPDLLETWYKEDTNADPNVFVLQPISSILINFNNKRVPKLQARDQSTWWDMMCKMQRLLRKGAKHLFDKGKISADMMHNYMMSVTEREVINGILNVANTRNHCLAYVRTVTDMDFSNLRVTSKFVDIANQAHDEDAKRLLSSLRDDRLPSKVESSNLKRYDIEWAENEGVESEKHEKYLRSFTQHFYKHITKLIDRAMRKEDCSSNVLIITEILQHLHYCNNSCEVISRKNGRVEFSKRILEFFEFCTIMKPLGVEVALEILKVWLSDAKRSLTYQQLEIVKGALYKCTLPVYVKLVFADICRWKSYSKPNETTLGSTIMDSIMRLFDRIEVAHGKILVTHAISYITAARNGASESELEDLISLDDRVLEDVYQYHIPPVRRIPPLLWTRIRNDLPNYLTERDADGISQNTSWELGEAAKKKPFKFTEIQRQRFNISDREGRADRKVPLQPLVYYNRKKEISRYNLRKFSELPYHLVRSNRLNDMFNHVLFNYEWLHSKLKVCPLQAILADFEDVKIRLTNKQDMRDTNLVADALRLSGSVLAQVSDMLAPQLLGRLLPMLHTHPMVTSLLQQCDNLGPKHCALIPCHHCLHTPGGPLNYSLEGQNFAVFGFKITSDHRYIISVSNKFVMWDLSTGEITRDINPDIQGIMQDLALSADNKYASTYTTNNLIVILDMLTGMVQTIDSRTVGKSVTMDESFSRQEENDDDIKSETKGDEEVLGIQLTNNDAIIWRKHDWFILRLKDGSLKETFSHESDGLLILRVNYKDESNYHVMTFEENRNSSLNIYSTINGQRCDPLEFYAGYAFSADQETLYTYTSNSHTEVGKFSFAGTQKWSIEQTMEFTSCDDDVLALQLCGFSNSCLVAFTYKGFQTWEITKNKVLSLKLPDNVRNISTKVTESQSNFVLTKNNQYAIAGVRKSLYLWEMVTGQLLKTIDAHFGRILRMETLCDSTTDGIISSSMDRSVKVWNIANIFEQVHAIDRHELPVNDLSICSQFNIVVTVTRNCIGLWNLETGKLLAKLADNPVGAIISHAVITDDARFVVSVESGYIMTWKLETYQVTIVSKKQHSDIHYLLLTNDNKLVITLSKDGAKSHVRCVARKTITLKEVYSYTHSVKNIKAPLLTSDGLHLVLIGSENGRDCLYIQHVKTGNFLHRIIPRSKKYFKDISRLVNFTGNPSLVAMIDGDRAMVVNIKTKKTVQTYARWNYCLTKDGGFGLYAPSRGGLEIINISDGSTSRSLVSRSTEGVFKIKTYFTKDDKYVVYYHNGRKTIRLFRVSDGFQIAEYRTSAELTCIDFSDDGTHVVIGAADGSLTILAIVDSEKPEHKLFVQKLSNRQENGNKDNLPRITFKMAANMALIAVRTSRMSQSENLKSDVISSQACSIS